MALWSPAGLAGHLCHSGGDGVEGGEDHDRGEHGDGQDASWKHS